MAARVRLSVTGHNRKTDVHAVAAVVVRTKTLRVLQLDGEVEVLRMLTDRRKALTRSITARTSARPLLTKSSSS